MEKQAQQPPKCNWWELTCTDEFGRIIHPLKIPDSVYEFIANQVKAGFNRGMLQSLEEREEHMNQQRRKKLEKLHELMTEISGQLEEIKDEEQEAYDDMPESLQESERGQAMYQAVENLESAIDSLSEALDHTEEAQQ